MGLGRPRSCDCGVCKKCKAREYMRGWYQRKTPEERRAWVAKRDRVRANKRRAAAVRRRRKEDPEYMRRQHARETLRNAVRDGRVKRGPCEQRGPGCEGPIHGHHDDYDKPLEVRWLCRAHHKRLHDEREGSA